MAALVDGRIPNEVWLGGWGGFWGLWGGIEGFFRVGAGTKLGAALSLYAALCRILFTRKRVQKDFINEKKVIFAEEGQTCPPPGPVLSALIIWSKSWLLLLECLRLPSWLSYSTHCSTESQVPWQLPKKQGAEKSAQTYLALETRSPRWAHSCRGSNPLLPRTQPLRSGWCALPRRQAPQSCGQPGQVEMFRTSKFLRLFKKYSFLVPIFQSATFGPSWVKSRHLKKMATIFLSRHFSFSKWQQDLE